MRPLQATDCAWTLTAEQEVHLSPEDCDYDAEQVAEIRKLEQKSEWGWCCAKITGSFCGMEASACLGAVSCESKEDFEASHSDYIDDMKAEVVAELQSAITKIADILSDSGP